MNQLKMGKFSLSSVLDQRQQHVSWCPMVWFKGRINKQSVCTWMALLDGLKTKSFLANRNISTDSLCILCRNSQESINHLLLHCNYSSPFWTTILAKFGATPQTCSSIEDQSNHLFSDSDHSSEDNIALIKV